MLMVIVATAVTAGPRSGRGWPGVPTNATDWPRRRDVGTGAMCVTPGRDPAGDGPRIATPQNAPASRRGHGATVNISRLAAIRQVMVVATTTGL
jgi:hypothetical protein